MYTKEEKCKHTQNEDSDSEHLSIVRNFKISTITNEYLMITETHTLFKCFYFGLNFKLKFQML